RSQRPAGGHQRETVARVAPLGRGETESASHPEASLGIGSTAHAAVMNFLKTHYEKILLGAVLVGLLVAAVLLPIKIKSEEEDLDRQRREITQRPSKSLDPLSLSRSEEALKRLEEPAKLNFAGD